MSDPKDNRSLDAIEKEIEQSRERLASAIDELAYRVKPANVAKRQTEQAKNSLYTATHTPAGDLRLEVVVPVAVAVVGLLAIAIARRVRG